MAKRRKFIKYPIFGSRQIAAILRRDGIVAGRYRVRWLTTKVALQAIHKCPRTNLSHPLYPIYPYRHCQGSRVLRSRSRSSNFDTGTDVAAPNPRRLQALDELRT